MEKNTQQTHDEVELNECALLVTQLLAVTWTGIQGAISRTDDGQLGVSIAIKLDHSGNERVVKAKISYAVRTSDEDERYVRDPQQKELEL